MSKRPDGGQRTMSGKLKPCPFCGGRKISHLHIGDSFCVRCNDCNGSIAPSYPNASPRNPNVWINAWNTRAEPQTDLTPAEEFMASVTQCLSLAKAAGCYVKIKVEEFDDDK